MSDEQPDRELFMGIAETMATALRERYGEQVNDPAFMRNCAVACEIMRQTLVDEFKRLKIESN